MGISDNCESLEKIRDVDLCFGNREVMLLSRFTARDESGEGRRGGLCGVILIELNLPGGSMHTARSSWLGKLARALLSQLRFITTLLRYRFRLRCVPLRSRIARRAFARGHEDDRANTIWLTRVIASESDIAQDDVGQGRDATRRVGDYT